VTYQFAHIVSYYRALLFKRQTARRWTKFYEYRELVGGDPLIARRNLMSGQEYLESVFTPNYCSPSSESYWSM
jgi:hypothetical protein